MNDIYENINDYNSKWQNIDLFDYIIVKVHS